MAANNTDEHDKRETNSTRAQTCMQCADPTSAPQHTPYLGQGRKIARGAARCPASSAGSCSGGRTVPQTAVLHYGGASIFGSGAALQYPAGHQGIPPRHGIVAPPGSRQPHRDAARRASRQLPGRRQHAVAPPGSWRTRVPQDCSRTFPVTSCIPSNRNYHRTRQACQTCRCADPVRLQAANRHAPPGSNRPSGAPVRLQAANRGSAAMQCH